MPARAVVLLSGGLDSTTALFWAKRKGLSVVALAFEYGQRHGREIAAARRVAARAGVKLEVVKLPLPWLKVSSLVDKKKALPKIALSRIGREVPSTYVPGRNTIFTALGFSLAESIGAGAVIIGANALDYSGYPDCRPLYFKALENAARLGTKQGAAGRPIRILMPLIKLDKKGIVRLAQKVKAPLELTWSCYQGRGRPCGACDSCQLRAKGFREAGIKDPALN